MHFVIYFFRSHWSFLFSLFTSFDVVDSNNSCAEAQHILVFTSKYAALLAYQNTYILQTSCFYTTQIEKYSYNLELLSYITEEV